MSSRRGLHPSSGGSGTGSRKTVTTADGGTTRLADVARQAGVSESTVSRVVNNKPGINPATRLAVTAALEALGYQSQEHLRERQDRLIGMITPELENPIFSLFARAIGAALIQQGYTPALHTLAPGGPGEDSHVKTLLQQGASGIIFVSGLHADATEDRDRYRDLVGRSLPMALMNGDLPDVEASFVSCDTRAAGRLAVSHLTSLGHRRIGMVIGPERYLPARGALDGYLEAMRTAGLREMVEVAPWFTAEDGQVAAARLMADGATAVVCGSDLMALGAVRAARAGGLSVPEDISVIGFDDSPLMSFTDPPLTTLRQPVAAMSATAVQMLAQVIDGRPLRNRRSTFGPTLVVRGSTGTRP
ncbi:LacI family DNA-binding transcriptional regulator [Catellatospora sichuanensis]|uniref:LacI family DNA-binding transcriptional regulator n=1 Tax=Catellatospora sichuanensis TaxID=1969805 RepID=UPI001183E948|nr:LacI family DNA-binding transcriptional regulator [Catellatospora sichuanensis]